MLNCFITGLFGLKGYQTSVPLCDPSDQRVTWLLKLTGVVCASDIYVLTGVLHLTAISLL